jgi:hypothetical protein
VKQASSGKAPAGQRMFPIAVDYGRFSGQQQEHGDTKRRQKGLADAWAEETGVPIDLRLGDDGVSGWGNADRRDNADEYDLARFLRLVEEGVRVQRGDYLLLENLDRLSRERMVPATHLLLSILMKGVKVVQLAPERLLLDDRSDMLAIFRAVLELARGHGESERKHQVCAASYANNRAASAQQQESYQGYLPAWVRREGSGKGARHRPIVLIPERAAVVRQVYLWAAEGWGYTRIARRLMKEGVPPFGGRVPRLDPETGEQARTRSGRLRWVKSGDKLGAGRWTRVYVVGMLRSRAAMGELLTHTGEVVPIPAAVTEAEWLDAQAARKERDKHRGRPRTAGPENIFQGLLKDAARPGEGFYSITRQGRGRQWRVLMNSGGKSNESEGTSFPEAVFEEAVLRCLREVDPADLTQRDGPDRVSVLSGRLEMVREQLAEMRAELSACTRVPRGMAQVMADLEDEEGRLEEERRQAQQEAAHPLSESWGQAQTLLALVSTAEQRLRLRSLLRRVVEGIWVLVVPRGWDRVAALQMRFRGTEEVRSYLIAYRKDVMPGGRKASRRRRERGEDTVTVRSLRHDGPLDLRQAGHVAELRERLAALDLASLAASPP